MNDITAPLDVDDMIAYIKSTWHSSEPFVYHDERGWLSFAEFWQRVAQKIAYLRTQTSSHYVLWLDRSDEFFAWLWACVLTQKDVVLPPALTTQLMDAWTAQGYVFVHQLGALSTDSIAIQDVNVDWQTALNRLGICFYTSGSTGQPKPIHRSMSQLLSEGQQVRQTFDFSENFIVFCSVSHQHLYGLTFGLLLPLMSGQTFYPEQLVYPEGLTYQLQRYQMLYPAYRQMIVISSPALLGRCAGVHEFGCERLFSSGGKLDAGVAEHYTQGITEIYGSSETGAVAYRDASCAVWQTLSDVKIGVSDEQTLMVKSPRAYQSDWIITQDLVAMSEQGLSLLGRADRIVKLEEKRLSLDEIEQAFCQLDVVDDVHVLLVEHGQRAFLSVAVALTASAKTMLSQGKKSVVRHIKQHLKSRLEPIAIPKHWRFVDELPRNTQSKLNKQWVRNLFLNQQYPHILSQKQHNETVHYRLQFSPELTCFKGHFDDFAIYPAVGQITFITHFIKENWTTLGYPCVFEQMKFQSPIRPYDVVDLVLERQGQKVRFALTRDDKTVATGRLVYGV